jgi:addiction module HigA family antidote
MKTHTPIHPGEVLREDFLIPLGLSEYRVAKDIGVPPRRINEIVKGKRLRTSNMCETLNSQIKRRTRVVGLFPNESSLLRLVTGVLIEISEEWETGKIYLQPATKNQAPN